MKVLKVCAAAFALLSTVCYGATIGIAISSSSRSLQDDIGLPLSGGNLAINGDGTQVRLGYFSGSTQASPFGIGATDAVASFISLTGPGTPFGINFTIGDSAANATGHGELFVSPFAINTGIADGLLPSVGTPLVLRFFNAAQTLILDVSNIAGQWNWKAPATPASTLVLDFDEGALVSRGNGTTNRTPVLAPAVANLRTTNAVPEPTSAALLVLGLVSLAARRRRTA